MRVDGVSCTILRCCRSSSKSGGGPSAVVAIEERVDMNNLSKLHQRD